MTKIIYKLAEVCHLHKCVDYCKKKDDIQNKFVKFIGNEMGFILGYIITSNVVPVIVEKVKEIKNKIQNTEFYEKNASNIDTSKDIFLSFLVIQLISITLDKYKKEKRKKEKGKGKIYSI
jgi:hypothetical protein